MQSSLREHKDNVGGLFNRYNISKVSWQKKIIQLNFCFSKFTDIKQESMFDIILRILTDSYFTDPKNQQQTIMG